MNRINVTKPLLPNIHDLTEGIQQIFESGIVTNGGPVHQRLEAALHSRLGGHGFLLFNNGTTALLAALASLRLPPGSEVITTPFTFAATTHAISLLGLVPVFADIDPVYMTLDTKSVRSKITERTSCILAVHVYGFPCDVDGLGALAKEKGLKLVYDAAHAFGVKIDGRQIGSFGDASAYSYHATKLFNTVEGGGLSVASDELAQAARDFRNFGIRNEELVAGVGQNGKMSEIHALIGELNLRQVEQQVEQRKKIANVYRTILGACTGITIPPPLPNVVGSYQYFPIRIPKRRDHLYEALKQKNIFSRKYFYPLVTDFLCYSEKYRSEEFPHAVHASQEVLCLPFYGELYPDDAERIAKHIIEILDSVGESS